VNEAFFNPEVEPDSAAFDRLEPEPAEGMRTPLRSTSLAEPLTPDIYIGGRGAVDPNQPGLPSTEDMDDRLYHFTAMQLHWDRISRPPITIAGRHTTRSRILTTPSKIIAGR